MAAGALASIATIALAAGCAQRPTPATRSWWSHVEFLAADSLEGRETGSPGHRKAAEYVARQFQASGALPAGVDGFFQPVAFVARRIEEDRSSLALVRDGAVEALRLGEDASIGMGVDAPPELEAGLAFVGYGLVVPERGYDDLAGIDLRGKLAVYLQGGPDSLPANLRSHAQSVGERWKRLREAGAIGVVSIGNPKRMDAPWERTTLGRLRPGMSLADPDLDETPGERLVIRVNPARAEKFFAGSGHSFAEMLALADRGQPLPRFPLVPSLRARVSYQRTTLSSDNVIGILPGSDPVLRDEYVVLSAHLDHLGVGGAIAGDSIYNGAMDNASGIATLIEIAREAKASKVALGRSLVLLAVTGEEKGLEGSRYFVERPTVPAAGIVADLNMDMFLPIVPFRRLTVQGLDESDLGDVARKVAAHLGVIAQADPAPERNSFIRSDQYSFITHGIPAAAFQFGYEKDTAEEAVFKAWRKNRYHAPSDDLTQPINREGAVRFTRLLLALAAEVANQRERPRWKDKSFFKRYAARRAQPERPESPAQAGPRP